MRERLLIGLLAIAALAAPTVANQPASCLDEAEYQKATRTILCDCGCHPQSVHECACGRAAEMRNEIRTEMSADCLTGDQLIERYVERHGEQVRIAPTAAGFNLLAWIGPSLGLFGAAVLVLFLLRRWSRQRQALQPDEAPGAPPPLDERYRDRLRRALENME